MDHQEAIIHANARGEGEVLNLSQHLNLCRNAHCLDIAEKQVGSLTPTLSKRRGRSTTFNLTVMEKKMYCRCVNFQNTFVGQVPAV